MPDSNRSRDVILTGGDVTKNVTFQRHTYSWYKSDRNEKQNYNLKNHNKTKCYTSDGTLHVSKTSHLRDAHINFDKFW